MNPLQLNFLFYLHAFFFFIWHSQLNVEINQAKAK